MANGGKTSTSTIPSGVFEASFGANGAVIRGKKLTIQEAEQNRKKGYNVVVCGPNVQSNYDRAKAIETNANGNVIHHAPHGQDALYHFQANSRSVKGHTFYETPPVRRAK